MANATARQDLRETPFRAAPDLMPLPSSCSGVAACQAGSAGGFMLPISAGILTGCGGVFLAVTLGFHPLPEGATWAVQSAVVASVVYYGAGEGAYSGGVRDVLSPVEVGDRGHEQ